MGKDRRAVKAGKKDEDEPEVMWFAASEMSEDRKKQFDDSIAEYEMYRHPVESLDSDEGEFPGGPGDESGEGFGDGGDSESSSLEDEKMPCQLGKITIGIERDGFVWYCFVHHSSTFSEVARMYLNFIFEKCAHNIDEVKKFAKEPGLSDAWSAHRTRT